MSNVKTNYVDYALKPVGSGNPVSLRKFETYNATTGALASTIYVKDVTDYATVGSNILASDLNAIGNAVNSNSANFASEYSPSATYAVNDYCTYQNVLYKCTTAITTPEAWNSAHWSAVKSMDEIGNAVITLQNNINNVVQSGSNSNGSYVKYDDGTMICSKHVNVTVSITNAWGSLFESSDINLGDFPASFTAAPVISATVSTTKSLSVGFGGWLEGVFASTASFVGQTYILRPDSVVNVPYTIDINAIGRWF